MPGGDSTRHAPESRRLECGQRGRGRGGSGERASTRTGYTKGFYVGRRIPQESAANTSPAIRPGCSDGSATNSAQSPSYQTRPRSTW